ELLVWYSAGPPVAVATPPAVTLLVAPDDIDEDAAVVANSGVRTLLPVRYGITSLAAENPMRDRKDAADERPAATMPVTAITPSSDGRTFCPAQMKATSLGEIPSLKRLMEKPPKVRKKYVTASAAVAKSADRMATCSFLAMRKRLDCHGLTATTVHHT